MNFATSSPESVFPEDGRQRGGQITIPFPTMIANEVMRSLISKLYRMWGDYNDPLVQMFEGLNKTYPGLFPRMFENSGDSRYSFRV